MSKAYIVTYDLCGKAKNYDSLISTIESYNLNFKLTESSWIIITECEFGLLAKNLSASLDTDDRIFISELKTDTIFAHKNLLSDASVLNKELLSCNSIIPTMF